MPNLLRRPLAWAVAAELAVVVACGAAAWHLLTSPRADPPVVTVSTPKPAPAAKKPAARVQPDPTARATPRAAPTVDPLAVDALARRAAADYPAWERTEWDLTRMITDYARGYIRDRVLPAIEAAARSR